MQYCDNFLDIKRFVNDKNPFKHNKTNIKPMGNSKNDSVCFDEIKKSE